MSYQVLARKWRPKLFREMVGQEHVLKALINALDHDRLHHAYLFTGTRGVGKTTIARILAKCLNCDIGVSSEPCNQCASCCEINEGRFVDLIEVDAASRTKVEDTRELLENVQYAPTRGRYKVYLIDEVHMLSNSSFNALLKTLEEPPPHVKFLLATTDPQKLPVTVLSRCLQFSLKNMSAERIVGHLQFILEKEMVPFEEAGLWLLGRSADGSMRDALSLTDQSISFGNGKITELDVRTMLGSIDQTLVYDVLNGLMTEDGAAILASVSNLAEHSPDYNEVMAELIAVLHRIAIAQVVPEAVDNSLGDRKQIYDFAQKISAEDIQLYYQTALLGRRDLPLSPDARSGLEMTLLRMLAFKPQGVADLPKKQLLQKERPQQVIAPLQEQQPAIDHSELSVNAEKQEGRQVKVESTPLATKIQQEAIDSAKKPKPESALLGEKSPSVNSIDSNINAFDEYANSQIEPRVPQAAIDKVSSIAVDQSTESGAVATSERGGNPQPVGQERLAEATEVQAEEILPEQTAGILQSASSLMDALTQEAPVHSAAQQIIDEQKHAKTELKKQVLSPSSKAVESFAQFSPDNWFAVYQQLDTGGLLQSTVANCIYVGQQENTLVFVLDEQQNTLYDSAHQQRLADLLSEYFGQTLEVSITSGQPKHETPAQIVVRLQKERQAQAEEAIATDPVVKRLQDNLGAIIIEGSIEPID